VTERPRPSRNEEEYFTLREAELIKTRHREAQEARRRADREAHFMKCPRCGVDLDTDTIHTVSANRCQECGGIWFDAEQAESLLRSEKGTALSLFKSLLRGVGG